MDWWQVRYWKGMLSIIFQRISIQATRDIINAIHDGSLAKAKFQTLPIFDLQFPSELPGVSSKILNPKASWTDPSDYDETLKKVAGMFRDNFKKF